jgi:hypothetical protein
LCGLWGCLCRRFPFPPQPVTAAGAPVNEQAGPRLSAGWQRVLSAGIAVSLITAGVIGRFALASGRRHGPDVPVAGTALILAGALGLLLTLPVPGPLSPARRRGSPRGNDSGATVLAFAEKRLYQGELSHGVPPARGAAAAMRPARQPRRLPVPGQRPASATAGGRVRAG